MNIYSTILQKIVKYLPRWLVLIILRKHIENFKRDMVSQVIYGDGSGKPIEMKGPQSLKTKDATEAAK